MIMAEYVTSLLISLACGMILGTAGLFGLRFILAKELDGYAVIGSLGPDVYIIAIIAYCIILLFADRHQLRNLPADPECLWRLSDPYKKKKYPQKWRWLILLTLLGVDLIHSSITGYEEVSILNAVLFLLGIYCLLNSLASLLLKWTSASDRRYLSRCCPRFPGSTGSGKMCAISSF